MSEAKLILHKGARQVSPDELREVRPPQPVGRWHPISHHRVLSVVTQTLIEAGYATEKSQLGLSPDGHRFFGVLRLTHQIAHGVTLAVGVRNSSDKTFPLGFVAGSSVLVCDNLAFRSELLVRKKHTRFGEQRFVTAIAGAVGALKSFQEAEAERIERFTRAELTDDQADALILRAYERGIIGARDLPRLIREWRTPAHADFKPRTVWSLFNAFTEALKERVTARPSEYALQTMRLNGLIDAHLPARPAVLSLPEAPPTVAV
jgi:hypothetical protein